MVACFVSIDAGKLLIRVICVWGVGLFRRSPTLHHVSEEPDDSPFRRPTGEVIVTRGSIHRWIDPIRPVIKGCIVQYQQNEMQSSTPLRWIASSNVCEPFATGTMSVVYTIRVYSTLPYVIMTRC